MTEHPKSDHHIRHGWPEFAVRLEFMARAEMGSVFDPVLFAAFVRLTEDRLTEGARTYGDGSFERPPESLIAEIQQELLDAAGGWASILWAQSGKGRQAVLMAIFGQLYALWCELEGMRRKAT